MNEKTWPKVTDHGDRMNAGMVSVVIPTYRRNRQLGLLLDDLMGQTRPADQIVIVDNDAAGGAAVVVDAYRGRLPLVYEVQPVQNISLTRNRTVAVAEGEWVASLDDDERVAPGWLAALLDAAQLYHADGVMGPVNGVVPEDAPAWLRKSNFYAHPNIPDGSVVPPNMLRMGNILLHRNWLAKQPGPFDPDYGLTGGEDLLMLGQLTQQGARIIWCQSALAWEPVEAKRLSTKWLLLRGMRGGQNFADFWRRGLFGPVDGLRVSVFLLRTLAQLVAALLFALCTLPLGRRHSVGWLIRAAANLGKLSAWIGWRYREYAAAGYRHRKS